LLHEARISRPMRGRKRMGVRGNMELFPEVEIRIICSFTGMR
jgi:hypothetical protein